MSVARRARHHAWSIPAALTLALALPAARGHAQEPAPRLRATLDGRELIGLSPDGRTILTRGPELTQGAKGVTLWDASTGQRRGTVRPGLGRVRPPLFSPDGSKLVLVSTEGEEDSFNVTLWEVKTGRKLGQAHVGTTVDPAVTFSPGGDEVRLRYIPGGEGPTRASGPIAVTRVDRLSAGEAADLAKIDQERRRTLVSEEASERARALLSGQPGLVISAAFAEDGRAMATHRRIGSLVVLDTETGRPRATLEAAEARVGPPLAISPDGTTLAVGRQGAGALLTLRDAATGRTKAELEVRPTGASALAFAPDGKTLAAVGRASPDATIRIWDVATGRERAALRGHEREIYCLAYAPDGGALASGAVNGTIRLWDPATGQPRMILKGMPGPVRALAFSPDGRTLASLPQFGPLTLWDVIAGRERARLADPRFGGGSTEVAALAFFADGQTLASAVHGGSVRLWDPATGRVRASFKVNEFLPTQVNATFSSDGRALAVGDGDRDWTLWDVEAGRERAKLVGQYSAVAIAPDGQGLFAVSDADVIQIWDLSRGPETGQDGGGAGSAPRPTDGTGGKPKAR